jgi:hypothetical protein
MPCLARHGHAVVQFERLLGNLFWKMSRSMSLSLQVDAKPLRAELVPITAAALERIKLLLLNMARQVSRRSAHRIS